MFSEINNSNLRRKSVFFAALTRPVLGRFQDSSKTGSGICFNKFFLVISTVCFWVFCQLFCRLFAAFFAIFFCCLFAAFFAAFFCQLFWACFLACFFECAVQKSVARFWSKLQSLKYVVIRFDIYN